MREVKGKGERQRYTQLNEEFQRIPCRDKKAFLREQCKELEGKNRMGKIRDLFKKIRDINRTFHAKMGSIKDRNSTDLTEAKEMKKSSPGLTYEARCSGLVHWDDPEGRDGEGGGRESQDGEHMYTHG